MLFFCFLFGVAPPKIMFRLTQIPSRFLCRLTPLDFLHRFLVRDWSIVGRCNKLLLLLLLYDHLTMPAGVAQRTTTNFDVWPDSHSAGLFSPFSCALFPRKKISSRDSSPTSVSHFTNPHCHRLTGANPKKKTHARPMSTRVVIRATKIRHRSHLRVANRFARWQSDY